MFEVSFNLSSKLVKPFLLRCTVFGSCFAATSVPITFIAVNVSACVSCHHFPVVGW